MTCSLSPVQLKKSDNRWDYLKSYTIKEGAFYSNYGSLAAEWRGRLLPSTFALTGGSALGTIDYQDYSRQHSLCQEDLLSAP